MAWANATPYNIRNREKPSKKQFPKRKKVIAGALAIIAVAGVGMIPLGG